MLLWHGEPTPAAAALFRTATAEQLGDQASAGPAGKIIADQ
jgi:hypothetical protein